MRGLAGKVGIVAGGGRGIGAATARRLGEEGAHVVIGDLRGDWAREVADSITASGGKAIGVDLDGTSAESQAGIVAAATGTYGGLDFYHSNLAGGTEGDNHALDCPVAVLDKSFAINAKSHFLATQAAIPALLERGGGAMVYTSSGAATGGMAWQVAYPMFKAATEALTRHVAAHFGRQHIRANAVSPGLIATEAASIFLTDQFVEDFKQTLPHWRLGKPEDIAAAVAFLVSDDSEYVNGQVWHVNGGKQMRA